MKYISLAALAMSLFVENLAMASDYFGVITGLGVGPGYDETCVGATSCVVVMVSSTHNEDKPECNTNGWSYAFDSGTDTGRSMLSIALAAEISKKEVYISGTGACDINETVEDLKYLYFF